MVQLSQVMELLDGVIAEYEAAPIDLLNIGDMVGETSYLVSARHSYARTLADVTELIAARLSEGCSVRILEVGAYLGIVSTTLARLGCEVTALDIPDFMGNPKLQERYQTEGVSTISANLKDYPLPLADGHYDLVIMCETLEHLNFNPLPALSEVSRSLRPGGRLYLALPNLASLPNRVHLMCGGSIHDPIKSFSEQLSRFGNMIVGIHWREYTRQELFELMAHVSLKVESHSYLTVPVSSLPARLIYKFFPALRPAQALIACKVKETECDFYFREATKS